MTKTNLHHTTHLAAPTTVGAAFLLALCKHAISKNLLSDYLEVTTISINFATPVAETPVAKL
jgi:hypothetical protein